MLKLRLGASGTLLFMCGPALVWLTFLVILQPQSPHITDLSHLVHTSNLAGADVDDEGLRSPADGQHHEGAVMRRLHSSGLMAEERLATQRDKKKFTVVVTLVADNNDGKQDPASSEDQVYARFLVLRQSLLRYLEKNDVEAVWLIVPSHRLQFYRLAVTDPLFRVVPHDEVAPGLAAMELAPRTDGQECLETKTAGRFRRQVLRLAAAHLVQTDFYLCLNADAIAVKRVASSDLILQGKGVVNNALDSQASQTFKASDTVLGYDPGEERNEEALLLADTPILLHKKAVQHLLNTIEAHSAMPWIAALAEPDVCSTWTEGQLYFTHLHNKGLFNKFHVNNNGALHSYNAWKWLDFNLFNVQALFRQSYSLFTVVQATGGRPAEVVWEKFKPFLEGNEQRRDLSWASFMTIRDDAEQDASESRWAEVQLSLVRNEAYITFVSDDRTALAAVVLGHSIRRTRTSRPLIVMITSDVSAKARQALAAVYSHLVRVPLINNPAVSDKTYLARHMATHLRYFPQWKVPSQLLNSYSKLHMWSLTEFTKLVYLDPDMLVLLPIDELFGQKECFGAVNDMLPPETFNTGLMVLTPHMSLHMAMLRKIRTLVSYDAGDQGFLNAFFHNLTGSAPPARLPFKYNVPVHLRAHSATAWSAQFESARAIRYATNIPYDDPECKDAQYGDMNRLWWSVWEEFMSTLKEEQQVNAVDALVQDLGITELQHKKRVNRIKEASCAACDLGSPVAWNGRLRKEVVVTLRTGPDVRVAVEENYSVNGTLASTQKYVSLSPEGEVLKAVVRRHLRGADISAVIDIGAGRQHGWFALYAAKLGRSVIAYEPDSMRMSRLCTSVQLNDLQGQILLRHAGAGSSVGRMLFYHLRNGSTIAVEPGAEASIWPSIESDGPSKLLQQQLLVQERPQRILLTDELSSQPASFLKITPGDGQEYQVAWGAKKWMRLRRIPLVYTEFSPSEVEARRVKAEQFVELFLSLGYTLDSLYSADGQKSRVEEQSAAQITQLCRSLDGGRCYILWTLQSESTATATISSRASSSPSKASAASATATTNNKPVAEKLTDGNKKPVTDKKLAAETKPVAAAVKTVAEKKNPAAENKLAEKKTIAVAEKKLVGETRPVAEKKLADEKTKPVAEKKKAVAEKLTDENKKPVTDKKLAAETKPMAAAAKTVAEKKTPAAENKLAEKKTIAVAEKPVAEKKKLVEETKPVAEKKNPAAENKLAEKKTIAVAEKKLADEKTKSVAEKKNPVAEKKPKQK